MQLVDMVRADTVRILLGVLVLAAISLAEPEPEPEPEANTDLKRMPQPADPAEPVEYKPSEKRSDQYMDEYETTEERIELDHNPMDPQRHKPHLQDEYHEKQTIEYMDDDKAPQAYKFGFEIKDVKHGQQYRHEQKDEKGNIQGRFGYRDAKGQYREVDYVADDYGFRAKIKTNEAGVKDQDPADVKIDKDKNEAVSVYPQHSDMNADYSQGTSAESEQYHQQPPKEILRQGAEPGYENQHQQSVNYESHSQHPYTQPKPHGDYHQSKSEHTAKHKEDPAAEVHRYFVMERKPHDPSPSQKQYQDDPDILYQREQPRQHSSYPKEHQDNGDVIYQREQPRQHSSSPKEHQDNGDVIYQREQPRQHSSSPKEHQDNGDVIYQREQPRQHSSSPKEHNDNHDVIYQREHPRQHSPSFKEFHDNHDIDYEREQPLEHSSSPKEYRNSPETVYKRKPVHEDYYDDPDIIYKPEHVQNPTPKYYHDAQENVYKKNPSHNQKEKPYTRRPSTYQYELDANGYSYRYPNTPASQSYQPPSSHAYNAYEKEYPANKYRQQIPDEHEVNKDVEYHPKHVILPQTGGQNSHVYANEHTHHHAPKDRDYPAKERHVLKYDYEDENKLGYSEIPKHSLGHVPVSHQYIRVVEEPQHSVSASYEKEKTPYVHRQVTYVRPESQPHSVMVLDPRTQTHPPHHQVVYGERPHEHTRPDNYHEHQQINPVQYEANVEALPKISHQESSRHVPEHDEQQPLQKAVLELNEDVYKDLLKNKSPGRIVAIPINQLNNGHHGSSKSNLHPVSGKPHGVLHIPLDGKTHSTIDLKNLPLVLQVPGGKDTVYQKPEYIHHERVNVENDKVPIIYAHGSRSSATKSSGRLNKNKEYEKSKWIPMTPSWRQKVRRKSYDEDSPVAKYHPSQETEIPKIALRLSDGGIYQILQTESSERLANIRNKPRRSKATRRVSSRSRKLKARQSDRSSS